MRTVADESTASQSSSAGVADTTTQKHIVTAENAAAIWSWLTTRGGLAIWRSTNPSRRGASWTTPVKAADGRLTTKPAPDAADTPERIITDPAEVMVSVDAEANHVPICRDPDGELSKASADAVYSAVVKAGERAYFRLEKDAKEAVIYAPVKQLPIPEWLRMTEAQRQQILRAPAKAPEQTNEEPTKDSSPTTSHIVDMTEEWLGRSIIITGAPKPKK